MPDSDAHQLETMLAIVSHVPSAVPWFVIPIATPNRVFVADRRDDASLAITEAIAGHHGQVLASDTRGDWVGVLLDPGETAATEAAGKLRGAYAMGTTDASADDDDGPF
ncbi:hypothetical protein [Planctomycetes bacterium TBK1r]|uniref:Uncharacterized protein n=1 Tax=Stieleria magnilauensis TaxID=2527963 RepID=A0ABX5XX88_9BACT|nr:hypothetical protein TBK1r_50780 [Planctomycetes bacterium TBK1r]